MLAGDHISFAVPQGEVLGFLRPTGAGKTTTQRMLTTLLEPTAGRIVTHGHDLARDAYPVKRQMGLVPEESNVYTELTAWDNLMFTATRYRLPRRARELLEAFGLWEKRGVKAEDFSNWLGVTDLNPADIPAQQDHHQRQKHRNAQSRQNPAQALDW